MPPSSLPRTLYGRIEDELLATFCKWTIPRWWNYVTPRTKRGTTDAECRGANPPKADETKEAEGREASQRGPFSKFRRSILLRRRRCRMTNWWKSVGLSGGTIPKTL